MTGDFVIGALSPDHDRSDFCCRVDPLDRYLKHQAGQDRRRHLANCFVVSPRESLTIAGYFTLAATSVPAVDIPPEFTKGLAKYHFLPATLIRRLAVDHRFRKKGIGKAMLLDAAQRVLSSDPASFALIVDAKDADAAAFYRHFQFEPLASRPMSLFLPLSFFAKLARIRSP